MPDTCNPPAHADVATVADVMVRAPRTLPVSTSVGQALDALADDHLHLLLLVEGAHLRGTLDRADLASPATGTADPALPLAALAGRTVRPGASAPAVMSAMRAAGLRRLAVTDADGRLLGLLCLKRHGQGFCSDEDVASRASRHR